MHYGNLMVHRALARILEVLRSPLHCISPHVDTTYKQTNRTEKEKKNKQELNKQQ